ncbi:Putative ankyrin repeat protein [Candidatus Norongarragalina meridionalis]|nr:Putative ankyrin repeat protein [Candidatus Norongarragalina meridionalis]
MPGKKGNPHIFKGPKQRIDSDSARVSGSPGFRAVPDHESSEKPFSVPNAQELLDKELLVAIYARDMPRFKALLHDGANVNTRLGNEPPLHLASRLGLVDFVKMLLAKGADATAVYGHGITPLHSLFMRFHPAGSERFLRFMFRMSPSKRQDSENRMRILRTLLAYHADPNARDLGGNAPLHYATCYGDLDLVQTLLESRVNPNQKNNLGETPLHFAHYFQIVSEGYLHRKVIDALLGAGADPKIHNAQGCIPECAFGTANRLWSGLKPRDLDTAIGRALDPRRKK